MNDFNETHPERKTDEKFLTNLRDESEYRDIGWESKRKGHQAYTINGEPINGMFPVFVKTNEVLRILEEYPLNTTE